MNGHQHNPPVPLGASDDGARLIVAQLARTWAAQTEAWLYHQVASLPAGIENHIICREVACLDQFNVPNIRCYEEIPIWRRKLSYGVLGRLGMPWLFEVREMKRVGAQVAHSHFGNIGWGNIQATRLAGCRHVVTFYGYDVQRLPRDDPRWALRYRQMFKAVDLVLAEGPHMRESLVKLGCPPLKAKIHHLGVPLDKLPFQPRRWHRDERLRILIAGSFVEKKGIPYAIEAVGRMTSEADLEVTIIGDAKNSLSAQTEKKRILESITACGLASRVRLLGYQPYDVLLRESSGHHIFLSPSVTASDGDCEGGAPVTIIEMAASGMPVVSTRHCDIPNVIVDGVSGWLAEERNPEQLAGHLQWLIRNPDSWEPTLETARKRIVEEFNATVQGSRLAGLYRSLPVPSANQDT
jgi:colanic acid/amylovoran biosynthesis glycosyltransferase